MTRLATARDFAEVDANTPEFRQALMMAGIVLDGRETTFNVYSRHSHHEVTVGVDEVLLEQLVIGSEAKLKLSPLAESEAVKIGKPSCWAFAPSENGGAAEIVILRYAANALHESSGIDVMSPRFQAELQAIADAFVAEGIHETLELNIAGYLFPAPTGMLTREDTYDEGYHMVTFTDETDEITRGNWRSAACWGFIQQQPVVTGICVRGFRGRRHWEDDDK